MRPAPKLLHWICLWLGLLGCVVAADVFLFRPPAEGGQRASLPPEPVERDGSMTVTWLGPPYYAGAREGLWVENLLEERFNLELKPVFLDPNGYERKKPLMIAGGPVPEFIWEANPIGLQRAVQHGFVTEIPLELLARLMPTYFREVTEEAPIAWIYSMVDGRNYGIPNLTREGARPKPGVWRMDWLRAVGIDRVPETLEEFEEALRRISRDDPDGNGLADTYGMSGDITNWWWVAFSDIFGAYGVLPFDWQEVDGAIVWGGLRPEARQALATLRRWYAEGLIHPEFVTDKMLPGQSLDRKFLSAKTGYIYYRGEQWNMDPTLSGSFAFNFLNLQFEHIVARDAGVAELLTGEIPVALLCHALGEELQRQLADRGPGAMPVSAATARWILQAGLIDRLVHRELFTDGPRRPGGNLYPENPDSHQRECLELRDSLLGRVLGPLDRDTYDAFTAAFAARAAETLAADGIDSTSTSLDSGARARAAAVLLGGRMDALAAEAWDWLLQRGVITAAPQPAPFRTILSGHYARLLRAELAPPVLATALFPAGPGGLRGARAWGKASNILTLGSPVAADPAVATRILRMLEEMYTDRVLSRETMSGREGIHWEWVDPVLREAGRGGITLKSDYIDPRTGESFDLNAGSNSMRHLLNVSMSFFNLLGASGTHKDYYAGRGSIEYRERYQREEWGLVNALGKSDVVPSASRYLSDLRMRQQTVYAEIIRGSLPLEAFDAFVAEWRGKGGNILLAEANRMHGDMQDTFNRIRGMLD